MEIENELMDIKEVSQYLNIKKSTLYSWVESGEIPYSKLGKLIRFRKKDIDLWIEERSNRGNQSDKKTKAILKTKNRSRLDINTVVKKVVAGFKNNQYTSDHGKPDRIKGLRKEVEYGVA